MLEKLKKVKDALETGRCWIVNGSHPDYAEVEEALTLLDEVIKRLDGPHADHLIIPLNSNMRGNHE